MIKLGQKYLDRITGFEGFATGHVVYISGCNQVLLAPPAKDGALVESHWFDDQRVEPIEAEVIILDNGLTPGFDCMAPKR